MIKSPSISVLVPVYKVEPYLQRCIDSVLIQDFKDYELILIDDGSPDRCGEICDYNATAYPDKIKVIHKKNGGLPSARKAGFEIAKGEYILHLDSDDYLLPQALKVLYEKAIDGNYDIVKGCSHRISDDGRLEKECPKILDEDIIGSENYLKALLRYDITPYIWGGIYRKPLFSNEIFDSVLTVSICEDWIINQAIWKSVHKYIAIDNVVCVYYINQNSMMQSKVISHNYIDKLGSMMYHFSNSAAPDIQYFISFDRIATHIRAFFIPEIPWNKEMYFKIVEFLYKNNNFSEMHKYIDPKFLRFIKYKYLFWLYCHTYQILFKYFKLKGRVRQVV